MSRLRLMSDLDLETVLNWRNSKKIRECMYTTRYISPEEHSKWFAKATSDERVNLLIYEEMSVAQGFVNITSTRSPLVANWGFFMAPDAPKGSGLKMGKLALEYGFENLALHKICGEVFDFNIRSINYHTALGFEIEGRLHEHFYVESKFHDVVLFGLLKQAWTNSVRN